MGRYSPVIIFEFEFIFYIEWGMQWGSRSVDRRLYECGGISKKWWGGMKVKKPNSFHTKRTWKMLNIYPREGQSDILSADSLSRYSINIYTHTITYRISMRAGNNRQISKETRTTANPLRVPSFVIDELFHCAHQMARKPIGWKLVGRELLTRRIIYRL